LLTAANSLDIGANGTTLGWARSFRIVNTSGSDGTDGGAFGVTGNGTKPLFVFMAIPTASSPTGYTSNKIIALDSLGNVGIGTSTPASRLEVLGQVSVNTGDVKLSSGQKLKWFADNDYITGSNTSHTLSLFTNATEKVTILSSGNVGIGTTHPDQPLTVKGQVHSTSVVVTSTVPADYVFNNNYYLRPLADVKAFVDKNHHLPEVPSAADFKKDGQNLGEMNMTLLKKVEELTLYLIELNKTLKAQQDEIAQLKNTRR